MRRCGHQTGSTLQGFRIHRRAWRFTRKAKQWKQLKIFETIGDFLYGRRIRKSLYLMRGPNEAATGEPTGIYRLTVPEGKWELFTKFTGMNASIQGAQDLFDNP